MSTSVLLLYEYNQLGKNSKPEDNWQVLAKSNSTHQTTLTNCLPKAELTSNQMVMDALL